MNTPPAQFEAKVRAEWMDEATANAWRRWHDKSVHFWDELTRELCAASHLAPGQRVLDLASGTGDPALTIAKRVGPTGHVVVTDLAPQMLEIARENAQRAGLANLSFAVVDAHTLPFAEGEFDRVTCRLGVMYFWDCRRALEEIHRVLKPGGIASFIAWGPVEENEYVRAALGPFKKRQPPPPPPPGAPQPYRFGEPGLLTAELSGAGFSRVSETARTLNAIWPGPPDELWTRLYEVSAPMRPYFNSFTPEIRADAVKEVVANLTQYFDGQRVTTKAAVVIATAEK
jgi:ubiquinone/menaquinone biosynthesis C-methylase UbiE